MDIGPPQLGAPDVAQTTEAPQVQPPQDNLNGFDSKKIAAEVQAKFQEWAQLRKPFEGSWFLNGAFLRGQQRVQYNDALGQLVSPIVPSGRIQLTINRIRPKIKARLAKFFQNRPRPVVVPASAEREDILNARATEKMLVYQWYREHLEEKYRDARLWATIASKSFLWIRWDPTVEAKVRQMNPLTGKPEDSIVPLGDIDVEVGSAFEIYPKDPTIPRIGQQPEFIRAKMRPLADIQQRYPELKFPQTNSDLSNSNSAVRVMDRLGALNAKSTDIVGTASAQKHDDQILVIEHFYAPCSTFPQGRYAVVVGQETAKCIAELPYGFSTHTDNPYPVVELSDSLTPGQFWGTTMIEQMLDLQREYNFVRSLISENMRMMARPKIVVYKQHNLAEGAWCVDPDTEVLSHSGWKNYETLLDGEEILGYDPSLRLNRWMPVKGINATPWKGRMVRLEGQRIDALVTPNHKWVVEKAQSQAKDSSFEFIETDQLISDSKHKWQIPAERLGGTFGQSIDKDPAFFEILGWVISDGYIERGKYVTISQSKPDGILAIHAALKAAGMKYTEYPNGKSGKAVKFYIPVESSKDIVAFLPNKRPSMDWITKASAGQLEAFLRGAVAGDGYHSAKWSGQVEFYNNDLELCNILQTICVLLGRRSTIRQKYAAGTVTQKDSKGNLKVYNRQDHYVVNLGAIKPIAIEKSTNIKMATVKSSDVDYDGVVWCPSVETGACVFKRNNKVFISGQTTAAGEIVELTWIPGLPPPQIVQPANIANDCWQLLGLINKEFDDLTLIYPSSVGGAGAATSGFQTNLLQEATDSVHAPDIREDELAIQELAWKMRKMMKLGYDVPRMISILGGNAAPEVFEFSKDQIDEFAEVRIQAGSMLPDLKSAKLQMAKELYTDGLFGNPQDPMVRRKVMSLIEMGGMEVINEDERKDQDEAHQELQILQQGGQVKPAQFYQEHIDHLWVHQSYLKSPEFQTLQPPIQQAIIAHTITHYDWYNPSLAIALRMQYGLQGMPLATPPPVMTPQQGNSQDPKQASTNPGPPGQPSGAPPNGPPQRPASAGQNASPASSGMQ